jgi:hypothetical protein
MSDLKIHLDDGHRHAPDFDQTIRIYMRRGFPFLGEDFKQPHPA